MGTNNARRGYAVEEAAEIQACPHLRLRRSPIATTRRGGSFHRAVCRHETQIGGFPETPLKNFPELNTRLAPVLRCLSKALWASTCDVYLRRGRLESSSRTPRKTGWHFDGTSTLHFTARYTLVGPPLIRGGHDPNMAGVQKKSSRSFR